MHLLALAFRLFLLLATEVSCSWLRGIPLEPEQQCGLLGYEDDDYKQQEKDIIMAYHGQIDMNAFFANFPRDPTFKMCAGLKPKLQELATTQEGAIQDVAKQVYSELVEFVLGNELAGMLDDPAARGRELRVAVSTLVLALEAAGFDPEKLDHVHWLGCHLCRFVQLWQSPATIVRRQEALQDLSPDETKELHEIVAKFLREAMLKKFPRRSSREFPLDHSDQYSKDADRLARKERNLAPLRSCLERIAGRISCRKALLISQWIVKIANPLSYAVMLGPFAGSQPASGANQLTLERLAKI